MRSPPLTSDFCALTAGEFALARVLARADFDPLTATTMALTAAGAAVKGYGAIIGGRMQQQEAEYEAEQLTQQSATDIAVAQRSALDQRLKTQLTVSAARAGAAAGGVTAGAGSAAINQVNLTGRGEYLAAMDLWKGQSQATGDLNAATARRYGGEIAKIGGEYAGAGSIIGGLADTAKAYTAFNYPTRYGAAVPSLG